MGAPKYYVFSVSEDGDVSLTEHTKEDLERQLSQDGWPTDIQIRDNIHGDIMQWSDRKGGNYVIIKGEIVVPKAVDVVVTRELP